MKFLAIDKIWDPDSGSNADWFSIHETLVVLLDGAAPQREVSVSACENDAVWLVRRFVELIEQSSQRVASSRCFVDPIESVRVQLENEYLELEHASQNGIAEKPFACLGAARIVDRYIEFVNMGDLSLLIRRKGGAVHRFGENAVRGLDHAAVALLRKELLRGTKPHAERVNAVWPTIQANRAQRNVLPGYEVLDPEASCQNAFERMLVDADDVTSFLWMSDGFYRLVDLYGRYSDVSLFDAAESVGLSALLLELRKIEDADPDCVEFPRFKVKDDATALFVHCGRGS